MANQDLISYIQQQLKDGVPADNIRANLRFSEWKEKDIEDAFSSVGGTQPNTALKSEKKKGLFYGFPPGATKPFKFLIIFLSFSFLMTGIILVLLGILSLISGNFIAGLVNIALGILVGALGRGLKLLRRWALYVEIASTVAGIIFVFVAAVVTVKLGIAVALVFMLVYNIVPVLVAVYLLKKRELFN